MTVKVHKTDEYADNKIAELERELVGAHEMLAFVLLAVGEPVVVDKQKLKDGLVGNTQIQIDDDIENNAFVFSLTEGS